MSNPLAILRKKQKVLLVVFGVVIMVSFVIVPPVMDYLQRSGGGGGPTRNDVVVSWNGGSFTEQSMENFGINHILVINFLQAMAQATSPRSPALMTMGASTVAPLRTRTSTISRACSPVSGWEISNSSVLTPSFLA